MTVLDRLDTLPNLNEQERQLLQSVKSLAADEIAPRAMHFDETGEFPWANVQAINELGLNAMFVPEAYGGAGMSYAAYLCCVREIASACASTGIIWATNFHATKPLIDFGSEEQKSRLLPRIADGGLASLAITEQDAGSDATGMKTTFKADGDDIVVHGSKIFITNGDVADLYLLFGKWSEIQDPKQAISVLILEKGTPGLSVIGLEKKMGHKASSTAAIAFDGCRVPRANLLGEPGSGLRILFASLNKSRPSVAAHALGIARSAFDRAVRHVNDRRQGGKRLIDNQGVQFLIAEMAADLVVSESWLWQVCDLVDRGESDFGIESSILKMKATETAMAVTQNAVQLHGGYGYCRDYEVERMMRDAKITEIWEGANEIHKGLIGRSFAARAGRF